MSSTTTREQTDRQEWEAYAHAEWTRITEEENLISVFDPAKLRKARRSVAVDELDAWKGPWRNVRAVAMTEFVEAVEAHRVSRITWGDWQARKRAERERELADAQDVSHVLASLDYLRQLMDRRGELIATARAAGTPWAEICEASGLSRMQAHTLAAQYRGEQPLEDCEPF